MKEFHLERVATFAAFRDRARWHLLRKTAPADLVWQTLDDDRQFLFPAGESVGRESGAQAETLRLPRVFVENAEVISRHRAPHRWALLYRVAWRVQNENPHLLHIETDDDVYALAVMRKQVEYDIYKMRAFVRFRRAGQDDSAPFVAWYRPDHDTLDANERFFAERFGGMRWAILTPDKSMIWDLTRIHYGPGVPRSEAPAEDAFEELWRTYYASIYNPARRNLDAMRAQLPVRRWQDLPESRVIPEMVRLSPGRVEGMIRLQPASAAAWIPDGAGLPRLREALRQCSACELCSRATQGVFGEGEESARILLAGEQPGDEEDRAGRPFAGPAGQVLMAAMREAGLDRSSVYLTNAVKAFRFEERGKRRIHKQPKPAHIAACRPWLEAEIATVCPAIIVCLGASAAQAVLGRTVRIREERGRPARHGSGAVVLVSYHPSAVLRARDEAARVEIQRALAEDLRAARSLASAA